MENIEVITRITYLFFIYLIMAIFVERVVEVLVSVYGYIELKCNLHSFWNNRARILQQRFDRLYGFQGSNAPRTEKILNWVLWKVIAERPYVGGKESVSAELIRLNYMRIGSRVLAFILSMGFTLALMYKLDIDLVLLVEKMLSGVEGMTSKIVGTLSQFKFLRVLITAAAISIGTEPLHQLISQIEKLAASKSGATGGAKS
ncbi:MAG TPA: hypothetical protein VGA99_04930 [bacterium]